MKPTINILLSNISRDEIRTAKLRGEDHLVAPVVMAVEGVMNGLFYPGEELGKYIGSWDGRPVTLFHPKDADGDFISANSPSVVETVHLGQLFNTTFEENKLKSEIWLNVATTKSVRPEVLEFFDGKRDKLEVSTGLWGDVSPQPGNFNGTNYQGVMRNIRPDHLALLPGGEGACNWSAGCGVRANCDDEGGKFVVHQNGTITVAGSLDEVTKILKAAHIAEGMTDMEIRGAVQTAVDQMDSNQYIHFIEAIIPESKEVVYYAEPRPSSNGEGSRERGKLYRCSYTVDANGRATLTGTPEEVRKRVTYLKMQEQGGISAMKKEEMIEALVADPRTKFEAGCKEFLQTLNEQQLDRLMPPDNVVIKTNEPEKPKDPPKGNQEPEKPQDPPKTATAAEYLANQTDMPENLRKLFGNLLANEELARNNLIETISKNPKNKLSKDRLMTLEKSDLEALSEMLAEPAPAPVANYGMRVPTGPPPVDDKGPEPLVVHSLEEAFKNKNK